MKFYSSPRKSAATWREYQQKQRASIGWRHNLIRLWSAMTHSWRSINVLFLDTVLMRSMISYHQDCYLIQNALHFILPL